MRIKTPLPEHPERLGTTEVHAAVLCGCSTPDRLAREWSITEGLARSLLQGAYDAGLVAIRQGAWKALGALQEPPDVRVVKSCGWTSIMPLRGRKRPR